MAAGPIIMASRLFCVIQMKGWRSRPLCATGNASVSTVNIAAVLCRVSTAHGQSVSVAASSIIMASRFLASSSCRLAISAILRRR